MKPPVRRSIPSGTIRDAETQMIGKNLLLADDDNEGNVDVEGVIQKGLSG